MPESIYINTPALIFGFLIEISFIFIYSFINIKYYKGKLFIILIGVAGFICSVTLEALTVKLLSKIFGEKSLIFTYSILFFPGVFEETGRYICLDCLVKTNNKIMAISYGIGHGGFESFVIGISLLNNLIMKDSLINQGILKVDLTFGIIFTGVFERFVCVFIQISLSVIVYKAVKKRKIKYFISAVFLHDFIDLFAFFYQRGIIKNIYVVEAIICLLSILLSRYAYKLYISLEDEIKEESNKIEITMKDKTGENELL